MSGSMQLIKTHDGRFGWKKSGQIKWCNTTGQLKAHGAINYDLSYFEFVSFCKEVDYAIDRMDQVGDTVAEFGIFGSFMYTTTEPEYEF